MAGNFKNDFHNSNFTQIHNELWKNEEVSDKAVRIMLYLLDKPNNWTFNQNAIAKFCKCSRTTVFRHLKMLKKLGYLSIEKSNTNGFSYIYTLTLPCFNSATCNSATCNSATCNSATCKNETHSNIIYNNTNISNIKGSINNNNNKKKENAREILAKHFNREISNVELKEFEKMIDKFEDLEIIEKALIEAVKNNVLKLSYVEAILVAWKNKHSAVDVDMSAYFEWAR